ncbi:MAG: selenium cofactor biosynthesis protein YqeC [Anaerolineae bacterium]|nr:selenium cofactor biosynthesis protein YqeC [Anaerolineae bacterium]
MKFQQAFEVARGDVVAFIGAGGKTSALIGMGYELIESGWRVLATTTTVIEEEQLALMPHAMYYNMKPEAISAALSEYGFVFLYDVICAGKVYGPSIEWTKQVLDTVDSDVLLIEADSSEGKPLKAPYADEPAIPKEASLVIPIASLSALDKPLDDENIYNSQAMIDKYGFYPSSRVRSPWIAQVLRDAELGLQGIPDKARVVAFINQTPNEGYLRGRARLIAKLALQSPRFNGVALGSIRAADPVLEVQRPVGAMVLAASASEHMDMPKVLLPWTRSRTIIEHIIVQLIKSRLNFVSVVTGHDAALVKSRAKAMDVKVVHNRGYKTGDRLSSLRVGLRAMPENVSAAMIVLADQPRIEPKVVYRLLKAYSEGQGDFLIPTFQTMRGYPMLIARRYWSEILDRRQTKSLSDLFDMLHDNITYLKVKTDTILSDINTLAGYHAERRKAGLQQINPLFRKPDASW